MFNPEAPPELAVSRWLNSSEPLTLAALKGRVVLLAAFQMLCPACVEHALPQMVRLYRRFNRAEVAIIGLHSVFEHHKAMTEAALEAFVHEYRWPFPIGIDAANGTSIPQTMTAYEMQGTPTLLLFDREGRLRRHYFGRPDDIMLAAEVMALAIEDAGAAREQAAGIERKLARTLVNPEHAHSHEHEHGEDCGCEHDHAHDHGSHDHGAHAKAR